MTVPNGDFSSLQIENYSARDKFWFHPALQLRYETTPDQIRYLLQELRAMLYAHPRVSPDPARVRFTTLNAYSVDLEIFSYVNAVDFDDFLEVQEDLLLRCMEIVAAAGTGFAFPSQTLYVARDQGLAAEKTEAATQTVRTRRDAGEMQVPRFDPERIARLRATLDYPPARIVGRGPRAALIPRGGRAIARRGGGISHPERRRDQSQGSSRTWAVPVVSKRTVSPMSSAVADVWRRVRTPASPVPAKAPGARRRVTELVATAEIDARHLTHRGRRGAGSGAGNGPGVRAGNQPHLLGAQHDQRAVAPPRPGHRDGSERAKCHILRDPGGQDDGLAEELRDPPVAWPAVEIARRADLRERARVHHRDPGAKGQRLGLVVRDEDRRDPRRVEQVDHRRAHRRAQAGVECRERLVEQHQPRPARHRAREGHALLLAARKLVRLARERRAREAHEIEQFADPRRAAGLGPGNPEPHVVSDAQMRKQRARPAPRGRRRADARGAPPAASASSAPSKVIRPASGASNPRDQPQKRGLAAARRADDGRPARVGQAEVDPADRRHVPECLGKTAQFEKRHRPAMRRACAKSTKVSGSDSATMISA